MAALALLTAAPLTAQAAFNQILYTANYTGTPVLGTDTLGGVTYATVGYGDLYNDGQPGMPYLPVDYLRFSVPYNATNFTVAATCPVMYKTTRNLSHLVYPSQPPRLMNDTTPVIITLPDSTAYSAGGSYPMQQAWVVDEGFLDGENHIVTVAVMPFVYKRTSTSDKLEQWKRVNVKLQYDLSDSLAMYPIVRNDSAMREDGYNLARSIVVNPGQVKTFAPVDISNDFDSLGINLYGTTGDGLNGGIFPGFDPPDPTPIDTTDLGSQEMYSISSRYPYLIVTTDEYVHSLRRLAALKRQKGYNVHLITLDEVFQSPYSNQGDVIGEGEDAHVSFTDDAGKIRQYLKFFFKYQGAKNVLLVGNNVPYRTISNVPTDWYYSDLNADYSMDEYNYYITFSKDYYADLNIGRILAKTTEQINNYTDKLLKYELNPGSGDYSYLTRAIVTQGHGFSVSDQFKARITYDLPTIIPNITYLNEQEGRVVSGKEVIDSINLRQYGFICSFNHGSPLGINVYGHGYTNATKHYIWALDSIKNASDNEIGNGLNNLQNRYYPMIYYALSCSVTPFGYNNGISFGESFTTGKNYGGPIFIGNTNDASEVGQPELLREFILKLKQSDYKVGTAFSLSKIGYDGRYMLRLTDNGLSQSLLGDPCVDMWTSIPQQYSGITVSRTDSTITISNISVDSTIVAICDYANTVSKRIVTSEDVTFHVFSPNASIMLYKHNYIPYIVPMIIQNVILDKSHYVFASDVTVGNNVDNGRMNGDVTVKKGIEYEIEASGTVTLSDGFKVERGATFAVYPLDL